MGDLVLVWSYCETVIDCYYCKSLRALSVFRGIGEDVLVFRECFFNLNFSLILVFVLDCFVLVF